MKSNFNDYVGVRSRAHLQTYNYYTLISFFVCVLQIWMSERIKVKSIYFPRLFYKGKLMVIKTFFKWNINLFFCSLYHHLQILFYINDFECNVLWKRINFRCFLISCT